MNSTLGAKRQRQIGGAYGDRQPRHLDLNRSIGRTTESGPKPGARRGGKRFRDCLVGAVVNFARRHGLRIAAQGTGHNAAPLDRLDNTVLVNTHASASAIRAVKSAMSRRASGQMYLNIADMHQDPHRFWTPVAYDRLRRIKSAVDPENVIWSNHPIPPAGPWLALASGRDDLPTSVGV